MTIQDQKPRPPCGPIPNLFTIENNKTKAAFLILFAIAMLLASCARKTDFQHNAYIIAGSCKMRQSRLAGSSPTGTLPFLEPVRIEETDSSSGLARIVTAKGAKGWIPLLETSMVSPRWKEIVIDDFLAISLPNDSVFQHMKNESGDGEGELTEFKFYNTDYFINIARTAEPWDELLARGKESAVRGCNHCTPGEISLGGLTGYYYRGSSEHDGMPVITCLIRGRGGVSYIFNVILMNDERGESYGLTGRHILFSARRR